jgi:putative tryptophan/tyrosine transport system substrate-binding protein
MRRREFIAGLGSAAAWPVVARAQQSTMPIIGFLSSGPASPNGYAALAFRLGLAEVGYVEGRNILIEYRGANWQWSQLPMLAADLVRRQVAVIVAAGFRNPTLAAKAATSTIPIVFAYGGDPVKAGFVANLNKPGSNITGVAAINSELGGKRLNLLCDMVPQLTTVAFLSNTSMDAEPSNNYDPEAQNKQLLEAAPALGRQVAFVFARDERYYEEVFANIVERRVGALIVGAFPFSHKIVQLAALHRIPTIYPRRDYVETGGLMSYAVGYAEIFRQVGIYTGRILRGEKAADLPVILPTKIELVINLKTAKTLGLDVPPSLLATADEVIE